MTSEPNDYFILRNGNTNGPCSLDEIRNYVTYGSMQPRDMVSLAGRAEWTPAAEVLAAAKDEDEPGSIESDPWLARVRYVARRTWQQLRGHAPARPSTLEIRRRVVRFREWEKVPMKARATNVAWRMVSGFVCNPPRLWAACAQVFASRVFRRTPDEAGYLKTWPKSMETVCACLIVLHAAFWSVMLFLLADKGAPVIQVLAKIVSESYHELMNG